MARDYDDQLRTCVVLGGRGSVGRWLVLRLLKLGDWIVRVADSAQSLQLDPFDYDSLLPEAISNGRASYFHVDVRNTNTIIKAFDGSSVVFYTDDNDLFRHDFYLCYTNIVQGAKNVINACRECKVKRLIYNSTADVVSDGSHDIRSGDESLPYSSKLDVWSDLKAQAEALVIFSNDVDGLLTCALRPSNVFGPGDKQLVPFLVEIAKSGWGKFFIGSDDCMSDFTYVENVAHALILAEEALGSRMVTVSGKVYFITNLEPMKFWEFVLLILEGLGYQRPMIKLPALFVRFIALLFKWLHSEKNSMKLSSSISVENVVRLGSHTRTFDCTAAQRHIGYSPVISLEDGVTSTIESFSHLAKDLCTRHKDFDEQSKVEKLLGSGKVAEILLWRDDKKSFTYFITLGLLYYWFFLCERTFIASAAKLLLLITLVLSGYRILSSKVFCFPIPRMSLSCFEIAEVDIKSSTMAIANSWNGVGHITRSLAQGEDWNLFLKVVVSLYLFNLIVANSLTSSVGVALVLAFTSFFVYEQYEEEIDGILKVVSNGTRKVMESLMSLLPKSITSLLRDNQ